MSFDITNYNCDIVSLFSITQVHFFLMLMWRKKWEGVWVLVCLGMEWDSAGRYQVPGIDTADTKFRDGGIEY